MKIKYAYRPFLWIVIYLLNVFTEVTKFDYTLIWIMVMLYIIEEIVEGR